MNVKYLTKYMFRIYFSSFINPTENKDFMQELENTDYYNVICENVSKLINGFSNR